MELKKISSVCSFKKRKQKLEHRNNCLINRSLCIDFLFYSAFLFTSDVMCGWLLRRSILAPNPLLGTLEYRTPGSDT
jgi:hypothetical protein